MLVPEPDRDGATACKGPEYLHFERGDALRPEPLRRVSLSTFRRVPSFSGELLAPANPYPGCRPPIAGVVLRSQMATEICCAHGVPWR